MNIEYNFTVIISVPKLGCQTETMQTADEINTKLRKSLYQKMSPNVAASSPRVTSMIFFKYF